MKTVRVLIIGKSKWLSDTKKLLSETQDSSEDSYQIETIDDEDDARGRLSHNSYDILIIHDRFLNVNSIELASMAYAMTRPSIIICSSLISYVKYLFWHFFSKFSRKFKTSKILISFNYKTKFILKQIKSITSGEKASRNYFDIINNEIKKNALL